MANRSQAECSWVLEGFDTDVIVHYGAGADYAVYVHEDMNARHKPGKTAKYLERPAREKKNEIFKIIAKG